MMSLGLSVFMGGNLDHRDHHLLPSSPASASRSSGASSAAPCLARAASTSTTRASSTPIVGIAESFGDAFIWLMWIYVLAPLAVDPGLTMTFQFMAGPASQLDRPRRHC